MDTKLNLLHLKEVLKISTNIKIFRVSIRSISVQITNTCLIGKKDAGSLYLLVGSNDNRAYRKMSLFFTLYSGDF